MNLEERRKATDGFDLENGYSYSSTFVLGEVFLLTNLSLYCHFFLVEISCLTSIVNLYKQRKFHHNLSKDILGTIHQWEHYYLKQLFLCPFEFYYTMRFLLQWAVLFNLSSLIKLLVYLLIHLLFDSCLIKCFMARGTVNSLICFPTVYKVKCL